MSGTYGEVHFQDLTKQAQTLLEEVNRIGRGREMAPRILLGCVSWVICSWYLHSSPVPQPMALVQAEEGSGPHSLLLWSWIPGSPPPQQGVISYWEMLPWVPETICFILLQPCSLDSYSPLAALKGGGVGWTEYPPSGWTILSQWDRIHWTSLLMQMSPLFRKLGLLTKDHYRSETQWEKAVEHALFPLLCL